MAMDEGLLLLFSHPLQSFFLAWQHESFLFLNFLLLSLHNSRKMIINSFSIRVRHLMRIINHSQWLFTLRNIRLELTCLSQLICLLLNLFADLVLNLLLPLLATFIKAWYRSVLSFLCNYIWFESTFFHLLDWFLPCEFLNLHLLDLFACMGGLI